MNIQNARAILTEAARLIELTAKFQARFGKQVKLNINTPQDAWALYDQIMDSQSIIANLLHPAALRNPQKTFGAWWQRYDVMDVGLAQHLLAETSHLLSCTVYRDYQAEDGSEARSIAVEAAQRSVAGLLNPRSYEIISDPDVLEQAV